ncbi:MAG: response regulator transcription factor [Elusimicrobiales bacterium]|jgi:DNA-binding response OmpR family regulator
MAYTIYAVAETEVRDSLDPLRDEFTLECFESAHKLIERLRQGAANLLLIDDELPDMRGIELLRVMRDTPYGRDLPVIFISAHRTKEFMTEAFGLGIDDYLQKPFDIRELRVRIRAVLRRRFESVEHWGEPITVGPIEIDPSQRRCLVDGERVSLRPLEFAVLEILMLKAGRVLSRNYLLNNVWHSISSADMRAVDTVISRLRKALGRSGGMIETVSKMGYYLVPPQTHRKSGRGGSKG